MQTPTNKSGVRCKAPGCINFSVTTPPSVEGTSTEGFCQGHYGRYLRFKQLQLAVSAYIRRGVDENDHRRKADIADYNKLQKELGINE